MSTRLQRAKALRAFTLVELAVVVVIVGVLSVIAVVAYRKLILNGKITEAQNNISGIRVAQEAYFSEKGAYANIGANGCPAGAGTSSIKVQWNPACSGGSLTWATLPVHFDGPVQFSYWTQAGASSFAAPSGAPSFVNYSGMATDRPWYLVDAKCDLDGSGAPDSELVTTSQGNQVFTQNLGY